MNEGFVRVGRRVHVDYLPSPSLPDPICGVVVCIECGNDGRLYAQVAAPDANGDCKWVVVDACQPCTHSKETHA